MSPTALFNSAAERILQSLAALPQIVVERTLAGMACALLRRAGAGQTLALVSDARTRAALAERLEHELRADYIIESILLPGEPAADEETVNLLRAKSQGCAMLVAVGGGTISDLCKYAAFQDGKPYAVFPTAPSMNGYTSATASIAVRGHKKTLPAALPVGVFCDLGVLAQAPARLVRSGVGDLLARGTAQADWLLSHLLHGTPYDARCFELTQDYERELFAQIDALMRGDAQAHELLMKLLLLSGLAMVLAGGSYPASQGEHAIAHAYEMAFGSNAYHGEAIGVTTLYMAQLQERLVGTLPVEVGEQIRAVMLPSSFIASLLTHMNAPATPEALGWNAAQFAEAVKRAPGIRERFGFLNLAE